MSDPASARGLSGAFPSSDFLPQRVSLLFRLSGRDVPVILPAALIVAFGLWGNIADAMLGAWIIWLLVARCRGMAMQVMSLTSPRPTVKRWPSPRSILFPRPLIQHLHVDL